jgi:hypothetical protein
MPWANSRAICTPRQVATDPAPRRMIAEPPLVITDLRPAVGRPNR